VSEKCFRSIAWSNVFKVGPPKAKRGNPNQELIAVQKKENTLKEELEILEPDVVIFSTGPRYDDFLSDFLPITCMSDAAPNHLGIKEIEIEDLDALVFRTYHFQYGPNWMFEQVVDHIRSRMNGTPL
jgi:hypothetical protein